MKSAATIRKTRRNSSSSIVVRGVNSLLAALMVWAGVPFVVCLCPRRQLTESSCCASAPESPKRYAHVYACCCEQISKAPSGSSKQSIQTACQSAKNSAVTAVTSALTTFVVDLHGSAPFTQMSTCRLLASRRAVNVDDFDSGPPLDFVLTYQHFLI